MGVIKEIIIDQEHNDTIYVCDYDILVHKPQTETREEILVITGKWLHIMQCITVDSQYLSDITSEATEDNVDIVTLDIWRVGMGIRPEEVLL